MKKSLIICLCIAGSASAHDHVEVGLNPTNSSQLGLEGPSIQLALYLPKGEVLSGYTPAFPGGCFASELTFTTETDVLDPAVDADPEVEILSVVGPAGGWFSFWEVGAASPTWSRPAGWNQSSGYRPSFPVNLGGNGHIHGRVFTVDRPGEYQATFRAVDRNTQFQNSLDYTITFRAQIPPPLSIRLSNSQAIISFTSRTNLTYELQTRTNLSSGTWDLVSTNAIDGDGTVKETVLPLSHPRAFFRLIEFK